MSSSQVPLWVPIVVALFGFAGVIGAQVVTSRRENRRWRRELDREKLRWRRERERDNRAYEGRSAAYAELVGAIEAFDWMLFEARQAVLADEQPPDERPAGELREVRARRGTASARRTCTPRNGSVVPCANH